MMDPTLFVIGPIVSLIILAGIGAAYFLWKERREDKASRSAHKN